ncbi:MAG: hypothetical protein IKJ41_03520 [Clostridia bacterium]|nr:hypothetical protein [Clostridia bacterium]
MKELNFCVISKNEDEKQSGDFTADNDLFNEVVSIITEEIIFKIENK